MAKHQSRFAFTEFVEYIQNTLVKNCIEEELFADIRVGENVGCKWHRAVAGMGKWKTNSNVKCSVRTRICPQNLSGQIFHVPTCHQMKGRVRRATLQYLRNLAKWPMLR